MPVVFNFGAFGDGVSESFKDINDIGADDGKRMTCSGQCETYGFGEIVFRSGEGCSCFKGFPQGGLSFLGAVFKVVQKLAQLLFPFR